MKKSKILQTKPNESHARSIVKAVSYRLVIIISIFITTLLTTGKLASAVQVTGITAITGTIIYYVHERIWSRIKWGRIK